jgi:transcriptional regulator with XRE-family HTH domain/KaiC/GvpD/RAD55 family RecA-like ATPase
MQGRARVASGIGELDRLLEGLYIGDNVVWHDDAGSLASVFCLNFLQASQAQEKPIIYVSFDRSPRNLLDMLGSLAEYDKMTILDCFTHGKGAGSSIFLDFYGNKQNQRACRISEVKEPGDSRQVMEILYGTHATLEGDVRFVFESLTGMEALWGGEDQVLGFYGHSCPRLYELNTVAYWVLEKKVHSSRLRAAINQIAQVAIDLSVKRGTTFLTILKAERRNLEILNKPYRYWVKDLNVIFDSDSRSRGAIDLGMRLKELRTKRGLSQKELADLVGVTPSTISQVESNLIYPSLPALLKMAEILSVQMSSFFQPKTETTSRIVFPSEEGVDIKFPDLPKGSIHAKLLTAPDLDSKAEPYLIEIPPKKTIPSHFFIHKGEEIGYLLSGKLQLKLKKAVYTARSGDVIYLANDMPSQWRNPGPSVARLLWLKVR